jgi:hypothetical protein
VEEEHKEAQLVVQEDLVVEALEDRLVWQELLILAAVLVEAMERHLLAAVE